MSPAPLNVTIEVESRRAGLGRRHAVECGAYEQIGQPGHSELLAGG